MPLQHEHHFRAVENLIYEWARAIDENRVEDICGLLSPEGRYTVQFTEKLTGLVFRE